MKNTIIHENGVEYKPNIPLSEHTDLRIAMLSRGFEPIPIETESKRPLLKDWTKIELSNAVIRSWENRPDLGSTGCRTGTLAGVDIDLTDAAHARVVSDVVQEALGLCEHRRIGHKPGGLLCYHNPKPLRKMTVTGTPPGAKGSQAVEFLGKGQQFVTHGWHAKKNGPYEWPDADLATDELKDLTEVTPERLVEAVSAVRAAFESLGYTDVKVRGTGLNASTASISKASGDLTPVTTQQFVDMFEVVARGCDYNEWIAWVPVWRYTPVVLAETGEPDEDFDRFGHFDEWSLSRGGKYDGAEALRVWNSFGEADARDGQADAKTVRSLVDEAKDNGYSGSTFYNATQAELKKLNGGAGRIAQLRGTAKGTPQGETAAPVDTENAPDADPAGTETTEEPVDSPLDHIFNVGEFLRRGKRREFLVKGWVPLNGITYWVALPGTGKSAVGTDMAARIATDMDWYGLPFNPTITASIYLCGEDDDGLETNLAVWQQVHDKTIDPARMIIADKVMRLDNETDVQVWIDALKEKLNGARPAIILDTWQRGTSHAGSQSDDEVIAKCIEQAEKLAKELDAPLIVLAHPPKSVKAEGEMTVMGTSLTQNTAVGITTFWDTDQGFRMTTRKTRGDKKGLNRTFEIKVEKVLDGKTDDFNEAYTGIYLELVGGQCADPEEDAARAEARSQAWARMVDLALNSDGYSPDVKAVKPNRKAVAEWVAKHAADDDDRDELGKWWHEELWRLAEAGGIGALGVTVNKEAITEVFGTMPGHVDFVHKEGVLMRVAAHMKNNKMYLTSKLSPLARRSERNDDTPN